MKALKYVVITVLTLVVLAILILVGVALFVNPNHFKAQIAAAVAKSTGRTLTIHGNIRWSFFPWLGLGVQDVSLSNAPGFGQTPFASLSEVDVSVKFLPLLRGDIDVGTVKLTNLQVNLVKQADGQTNWADLIKSNSVANPAIAAPIHLPSQSASASNVPTTANKYKPSQMIVDRIIVNNAKISWQNLQNHVQKTVIIDKLNASNLNSYGDPFSLLVGLRVSGPANQQPYDLNLAVNGQLNNNTQKLDVSKFLIALNNLQINGNLQVTQLSDNPNIELQFDLPKMDMTKWLNSIGEPITFKDSDALRNVSMSGHLSGGVNHIALSKFKGMLDGTAITLNVNMSNLKNLVGTFNFSADTLNLDKYQTVPSTSNQNAVAPAPATTPSSVNQSHAAFTLPDSLVTGHITIGSLIAHQLTINQINSDVSVKNQKITLSPLSANFYGGQLADTLSADFSGKVPVYNVSETLTGASLAALLKDIAGKPSASGTLNLNANISAAGIDANSILGSLNGTGGLAVQSGLLPGLNITQALAAAASTVLGQSLASTTSGTSFSNLSATFSVQHGLVQSNNLVLNSPLFTVAGTGSADLVSQKLAWNIKVTPTTANVPQIQALTNAIGGAIPLQVGGTISHPTVTPDVAAIALAVGKNKLGTGLQKIGDQINQGGKNLGKTLQSLFK